MALPTRHHWKQLPIGLVPCAVLALTAGELAQAPVLAMRGIGTAALAIVFGAIAGNLLPSRWLGRAGAGIVFAQRELLRLGVALYGLRLTATQVLTAGAGGLLADVLMIAATLALAGWIGTRWLRMDRETALLVGAGSAICGAAAVMAAEPVLRAPPARAAVAVATVTLYGSLAILIYPLLYPWLGLAPAQFGTYVGSTVHEVAQVVAVGRDLSPAVADQAVIVKLIRVLLLAPVLLILARVAMPDAAPGAPRARVPGFVLAFIAMAGVRSAGLVPTIWLAPVLQADDVLLAMAMAGLGFGAHRRLLREAGLKPLLLGAILFVWLIGGGWAINAGLDALAG